jgi:hypothetical protein
LIRLQSHGSKVLWSSNMHLANWYTSGTTITFLDYTDSSTTFVSILHKVFQLCHWRPAMTETRGW